MDDIKVRFGSQLRSIRKENELSLEELSFRCGLSKNYLSDVERGTRNLSLEAIEKISRGLKIEIKDLFEWR